jgi:hypothetical protein
MAKKPADEVGSTCGVCTHYCPESPEEGTCYAMPPIVIAEEGEYHAVRPVVEAKERKCMFFSRRLDS